MPPCPDPGRVTATAHHYQPFACRLRRLCVLTSGEAGLGAQQEQKRSGSERHRRPAWSHERDF